MSKPSRTKPLLAFSCQLALCLFLVFFIGSYLRPSRAFHEAGIINIHEHIASLDVSKAYQKAAKANGINHTIVLGSPEAVFRPDRRGFFKFDQNNELALQLAESQPDLYTAFVTIDPQDPDKLKKLKKYVRRGALGLKLYSGHSRYRQKPLLDESMKPIFSYCEKKDLPIMFHVNPALYQAEFESVLNHYPRLRVICPHFCLSTQRIDRFETLMNRYPNLYTDMSFGFMAFLEEALLRFSEQPDRYRDVVLKYQDRILFGLDLVVSEEDYKDEDWIKGMMQVYKDLLEKDHFVFAEMPGVSLRGFHLDPSVRAKIYHLNAEKILSKQRKL